jgi:hypothetical protein
MLRLQAKSVVFLFVFVLVGMGLRTQGFVLAKQALYG